MILKGQVPTDSTWYRFVIGPILHVGFETNPQIMCFWWDGRVPESERVEQYLRVVRTDTLLIPTSIHVGSALTPQREAWHMMATDEEGTQQKPVAISTGEKFVLSNGQRDRLSIIEKYNRK